MNKKDIWINAIAYIVFFVPLLVDRNNEEYKFHANQGINLLLLFIAMSAIGTIVPVIGWFLILPLSGVLCLVLCIMGVINSINENMKELPLIGKYRMIK